MNLKELREQQGLTQSEVAEITGVTKETVYLWERGIKTGSLMQFFRYFQALGLFKEDVCRDDSGTPKVSA